MGKTLWIRLGSVLLLTLVMGCGGGGGDDFDGPDVGAYWTAIDINTSPCGPPINEQGLGSDLTELPADRIRLDVYLEGSPGCMAQTWTIFGTRTSPTTADMDDVINDFLCELDEVYGYGFFDITNFTLEVLPDYIQLQGFFSAEHDGGTCTGSIFITLDDS